MTFQAAPARLILGIESSCDDTAAAIVSLPPGGRPVVHASIVVGQDHQHANYGGVVPEIAARAHAQHLDRVTRQALDAAGTALSDIHLIAATAGPGLIGGVMSGFTFAKGLALATETPLIPVNHLVGHALSPQLEREVPYPYLLLLVSGGHTQLVLVKGPAAFRRLGTTIDDAAGEAFDKTAKLLRLNGAGGPAIERLAASGDAAAIRLPMPLAGREGCDFSFSGLKTAVRQRVEHAAKDDSLVPADIAASFQRTAVAHLISRTGRAMAIAAEDGARHLVAAGGVAANGALRAALGELAAAHGWELTIPGLSYCTDNAAMIALAGGLMHEARGNGPPAEDPFALAPRPRWPLDERPSDVTLGSGRKGRKA